MKIVLSIIGTLVVIAVVGFIYITSGSYNVSVSNRDTGISRWILETTMDNSVEKHAKDIPVPSLSDTAMIWKGFTHYDRMCGCHPTPGEEQNTRFNPEPPPLYKTITDLKPNELFWIVKNGIKMSAMPSFGERSTDDEIWTIVAFLQELPKLTPEGYQALHERLRQMMEKQQQQKGRFNKN
jgi:Cytochrome C oxidase, cbb3-type, subunit III